MKYRKNPVVRRLEELEERASEFQDEVANLRESLEDEDVDEKRKRNPYRR